MPLQQNISGIFLVAPTTKHICIFLVAPTAKYICIFLVAPTAKHQKVFFSLIDFFSNVFSPRYYSQTTNKYSPTLIYFGITRHFEGVCSMQNYGQFWNDKTSCMFQEGCAVPCATCRIINRLIKKGGKSLEERGCRIIDFGGLRLHTKFWRGFQHAEWWTDFNIKSSMQNLNRVCMNVE